MATHAPETAARLRTLADLLDRGAVVDCAVRWAAGAPAEIVAHDALGVTVAVGPTDPPTKG